MNPSQWFLKSLLMLIFSVTALAASLFLYIYWYVEVSAGLRSVIEKFNIDAEQAVASETWVVILVLSILFSIILMGLFLIYVYSQKALQLYRLQHNFINNFTHELKTPVTSIKLYLETFIKHDLPRTEQLKYIQYMLADSNRLSDNISRILNLAKIESRSYSADFVQTDLETAVRSFFKDNAHLFENADIRIENPSGNPILHPIDRDLFEMLLMNLATNALKYNHSKKPEIRVRFRQEPKAIHILFADNGIGLEKKERKKIFKKFYQSGRSDDMTAKGTGLGLFMVQMVARIHRGRVSAGSAGPGKGSEFILSMPRENRRIGTESAN